MVPNVSVIIPVYNVEKYLRECLDSVINQTLKDIEIILVDDGSTDSSLSVCQEYAQKDNRITIFTQKNQGAGAARNKGIKLAHGEYLSFLDADDFFELNMLELMYKTAESQKTDIVICDVFHFDNKTNKIEYFEETIKKEFIPSKDTFNYKDFPNYIFNCFQNWTWNKLFNTQFIQKNDIKFQEIKRTNDLYFTCCALVLADKISYIDKRLVYYRYGTDNNAQSTNYIAPTDFAKAFIKLKNFLVENNLYEVVKQSYINWALSGCLYNIFSLRHHPKSQKKLLNYLTKEGFLKLDITESNKNLFFNESEYNKLQRICYSTLHYKNIFQRIFSIKNAQNHKVITICGVKIRTKLNRGV